MAVVVNRLVSTFSGLNFQSATWKSGTVATFAVFPDIPVAPKSAIRKCLTSQLTLSPEVEELWAAVEPDGMLTESFVAIGWEGFASPTQGTRTPLAGVDLSLSRLLNESSRLKAQRTGVFWLTAPPSISHRDRLDEPL